MHLKAARFTNLLLTGILTGIYVRDVLTAPGVRRFSGPMYAQYHQELDRTMAPVMRPIAQSTLVTSLVVLVLGWRRPMPSVALSVAALGCLLAQIGVTSRYEVPLNQEVQAWSAATLPDHWVLTRERWIWGHQVRTVLGLMGLSCQILAVLD